MSFFYDLNKKLNGIRELPETTHKQLNESKPDFLDLDKDGNTKEPMKQAAKQKPDYKSKMQDKFGGSAADLTRGLSIKSKKVNELDASTVARYQDKAFDKYMSGDEKRSQGLDRAYKKQTGAPGHVSTTQTKNVGEEAGMSRAAKGYEKYGKQGMQALAKAGREGKALDPVRNKYDKYDESMAEGMHSKDAMELNPDFARVGKKPGVLGKIAKGIKRVADFVAPGDEDLIRDLERKTGGRRPAKVAEETGLNKSVEAASEIINKTDPYSEHVGSLGSNHVFFSGSSGSDEHIYHIFNDKTKETDTVSFYHEGKPQSLKDIAAAVYDYSIAKIIHGHHKDNLDESVNLENLDESIDYDKVLDAIAALYGPDIWENDAMQDLANDLEQAGPTDRELDFIIAKGKLPKRLANTQFSAGDNVRFGEGAAPMTPKQKSFAALAAPKDKITFADKIAGAKKEVDEMLGDVAAEAMKSALGKGKQPVRGMGEATREIPGGRRHTSEPGGYGRRDDEDAPKVQTQRGRGRPKKGSDSETGQVMKPDFSAFGVGGKVNLPKHKGAVTKHKMVGEEASDDDREVLERLMDEAFADGKNSLGNAIQGVLEMMSDEKPVNEKAVSKKQQRFMGMVHAAKKGAEPASKEVARAAKGISAKEADKFASTKHKGLPDKVKEEDTDTRDTKAEKAGKQVTKDIEYDEKAKDGDHGSKRGAQDAKAEKAGKKVAKDIEHDEKVEETTTSGSVATASAAGGKKSSGGFNFGGGIYDSMNRDLENMIAESMTRLDESMNISMNMNSDSHGGPTKSLTITATEDDADKLAMMLKMAGMGSDHGQAYSQAPDMVDENKPDWPTNTETSDDAFQYSGGLNKPKRDVAGDGQATGQVTAVSSVDHDNKHDDKLSEASDSDMADRVRDLVGDFDRNMTQMRVYGDPDVDRAIAYLKQGNAEAAVEVVVDTYGTQDGGEFRNMSDYAQDLLGDFESLIGSGQDDLARMMEMAGVKKKAVDEEKTEEGNKFTGNLAKARAAGKKEADLDGDGDMEKVQESIFDLQRLWKAYKG
jgi:hypothetical protein